MSLPLQTDWCDKTLDFRCLESLGFSLFLWERPLDDVLTDIIFLCQVVELPNLANTFRSQSSWNGVVCEARDLIISFFDNNKVEDAQVAINDTATD